MSNDNLEASIDALFQSNLGVDLTVIYLTKQLNVPRADINRIITQKPRKYERLNPNQGNPIYKYLNFNLLYLTFFNFFLF